jgi:hypothetical protein
VRRAARIPLSIVSFASLRLQRPCQGAALEPEDSRPGTPSLLADPATRSAEPTAFREIQTSAATPSEAPTPGARQGSWRVPALVVVLIAVVAVAALAYSGVFGEGAADEVPASAVATVRPAVDVPAVSADAQAAPAGGAAVILPDATQGSAPDSSATPAPAGGLLAALPTGTAAGAAAVAASVGQVATASATPAASAHVPASTHRRVAAHQYRKDDSDVSLLAALITHVQKGGPHAWQKAQALGPGEDLQGLEMQSCPAANTKAGLTCRARICKGHVGQSPSCPAPASKDD